MEIASLICANAGPGDAGRLDIQGVFSELFAVGFPARQDRLVLVVLLHWAHEDAGRIEFRIDLVDEAGDAIFTIDGHTDVEARPVSLPPARTQLVLPLHNILFPAAGHYRFRMKIGESLLDGASLFVCEQGQQADGTAAPDGS